MVSFFTVYPVQICVKNTDVELTQPESNENKTVPINRVRRSTRRVKETRDGSRSA